MFEKRDQVHVKNLLKMLSKAKFELEGAEVLAAADVFRWVGVLDQKIDKDLQAQETQAKALQGELTEKQAQPPLPTAPEAPAKRQKGQKKPD